MYVAPRPLLEDDPLLAPRVAFMSVAGLAAGILIGSPMLSMYASLPLSMTAGIRGAFNPGRAFGGPIALAAIMWIMSGAVILLAPMPTFLTLFVGLVYFIAFFLILRTGNAMGMLLIVGVALTAIMGMGSIMMMEVLRDEMTKAAMVTAVLMPIAYLLFPSRASWKDDPQYVPAPGASYVTRAAIRAVVMLAYTFWLMTTLDVSNLMLAIGGMFVLTFPTNRLLFSEAIDRSYSTIIGGLAGLLILLVAQLTAHLDVLMLLLFAGVLLFTWKMFTGRRPAMVYQYAGSVLVTMVAGAFTTLDPGYVFLQRVVLTLGGAIAAAFITALLEALLVKEEGDAPSSGEVGEDAQISRHPA